MNRNFAKIKADETSLEYAPSALHTDHGLSFNPSEADYLAAGWLKVVNNQPETREGFYPVRGKYVEVEGHIETEWKYEPIPVTPKTYNKYKLVSAVIAADLIEQLLAFLNDNPAMKMLWDAAQEFNEADEYFKGIRNRLIGEFGEEAVTAVLKAAEV